MRILVTGGRNYSDWIKLRRVLDEQVEGFDPEEVILIHGGATGADTLARQWATTRGIHAAEVNPLWDKFGASAGPIRNRAMLMLRPDVAVAFPGGPGTASMVKLLYADGVDVVTVT